MLQIEVNNQYDELLDPVAATIARCQRLAASGRFPVGGGELSVAFVDDAAIARVHADFMNDPSPTDVITFPADPDMDSAGEIIISVDQARSRAAEHCQSFSQELALYLIHGWLHLAGYDDRCDDDRARMREAEQAALALVGADQSCIDYELRSPPTT